jgi:cell division transport system ATP-binding protein
VATSESNIVNLEHVDKIYLPKQDALRDLTFRARRGEFVFVAGASGAGKSTLLKLLFAEERATRGTVSIGNRDVSNLSREGVAHLRRSVGVIFQDYKLLQTRTVLDNVTFPLEILGVRKQFREELAVNMLNALGLKDRIKSFPQYLSGGEQQRVAIARSLMNRPQLILADEPTGNLDPDMTMAVFDLLLEACNCGATVIVATHNLRLIQELNRRTIVLEKGRLIGDFQYPSGQVSDGSGGSENV